MRSSPSAARTCRPRSARGHSWSPTPCSLDSPDVDAVELFCTARTDLRPVRAIALLRPGPLAPVPCFPRSVGPDDTVLDVATGTCAVAIELARRTGCRVVGLDQSPEDAETGRRRVATAGLEDRIELVDGTADRLPFEDAALDALTFTYLLRYVPDRARRCGGSPASCGPAGRSRCSSSACRGARGRRGSSTSASDCRRSGRSSRRAGGGWDRSSGRASASFTRHDLRGLWRNAGIEDVHSRRLARRWPRALGATLVTVPRSTRSSPAAGATT